MMYDMSEAMRSEKRKKKKKREKRKKEMMYDMSEAMRSEARRSAMMYGMMEHTHTHTHTLSLSLSAGPRVRSKTLGSTLVPLVCLEKHSQALRA